MKHFRNNICLDTCEGVCVDNINGVNAKKLAQYLTKRQSPSSSPLPICFGFGSTISDLIKTEAREQRPTIATVALELKKARQIQIEGTVIKNSIQPPPSPPPPPGSITPPSSSSWDYFFAIDTETNVD
ncbi:hypothetical protein L6452_30321 [Arctium lappa]|uniref:Uncharacterized protein n=1 Tax=Arctium lappa TaxID=4217 RepID=A0ACB8ZID4_ARCLA|nr:hypothetical protein L6452_30321 [Arctium lappa]